MFIDEENIVKNAYDLQIKQKEISSSCQLASDKCRELSHAMSKLSDNVGNKYNELAEFFTVYNKGLQENVYDFLYKSNRYKDENKALELSISNEIKEIASLIE